jgi:hypothetical protein
VATHGALGAAWVSTSTPQARATPTCINTPAPDLHFSPPAELLAMHVSTVTSLDPPRP